jgi:hypothetical protein
MNHGCRHPDRGRRRRGFRIAILAVLAYLWMPVLHAQHGGDPAALIPPELHGTLCLASDTDAPSRHDSAHQLPDCECLTCKVMHHGMPAILPTMERPAATAESPVQHRVASVTIAPTFSRPPSRAPPLS